MLKVALFLLLAACASPDGGATTTAPEADMPTTTGTVSDPTVDTDGAVTTTSQPEATETTSDRPLAPDFTLELGDGGTYTLSDSERPVYLVFWAEW